VGVRRVAGWIEHGGEDATVGEVGGGGGCDGWRSATRGAGDVEREGPIRQRPPRLLQVSPGYRGSSPRGSRRRRPSTNLVRRGPKLSIDRIWAWNTAERSHLIGRTN